MNGAMMLPELDMELANTRKTLARVPDEHLEWRPHEKSWTLRELATHLANLLSWTKVTLDTDELDLAGPFEQPQPQSRDEILALFDANAAEARAAVEAATGDDLAASWSLKMSGETAFTMPKGAVLRSFVFNHNVHHRAQLTVYFRLLGVPVPALYGPSADEEM